MQVPFFLFVVFVVYTLLPFSTRGAVVAGVVSSTSHLLVLGALMGAFTTPSIRVGLQVRGVWVWARGRLRPWVGLWFGPREAKAGAGELEALETEVFANRWPRGRASSKLAGALPCSLFFAGLGYPRGSAPPSSPDPRASFLGPAHCCWVRPCSRGFARSAQSPLWTGLDAPSGVLCVE